MNCRFTPIDARNWIVLRPLVGITTLTRMALPHRPGEGSRGSS